MAEVSTIVVGAASSSAGMAAVEHAATRAIENGARLILVGHVDRPRSDNEAEKYLRALDECERDTEKLAACLRARGATVEVIVPRAMGTPAEAVLAAASTVEADLVVVGVRRRSRVGKLLLGSNAQDILLGAQCAVLAVKAPDNDGNAG